MSRTVAPSVLRRKYTLLVECYNFSNLILMSFAHGHHAVEIIVLHHSSPVQVAILNFMVDFKDRLVLQAFDLTFIEVIEIHERCLQILVGLSIRVNIR